jgi:CRISPR system Cascade subunit CasA
MLRAHEIVELATDNPLETLALNRLLAALAASVFEELAEETVWLAVWDRGRFDPEQCEEYFNHAEWSDHFDLLSPTRPFFGHPHPDAKEVSPVSRLLHAAASGNNAVLFSHNLDSNAKPMALDEAARAVVCTQAAALGGGVAQPFNLCHAPLVGGAFFWLRGRVDEVPSLFHALLLNLAPTQKIWGNPERDAGPAWAAKALPNAQKDRQVNGIRDLFTFQSRRLQLVLGPNGKEVVGVRYNQGSKMDLRFHDPHLAYRQGPEGEFPMRFGTEKALWQDSGVYMTALHSAGHAPRTFEWLSDPEILDLLGLPRNAAFAADVFGMVNDQAKVELWRHERVTIYPNIINDANRAGTLKNLLDNPLSPGIDAKKQASRLREATRAFAMRARLNKTWGTRLGDVERADCDAFVQMLDTGSRYWTKLGSHFTTYLARVATLPVEELPNVEKSWQMCIRKAATAAMEEALHSLAHDARTWQALADANMILTYGTLYPKHEKNKHNEKEE